MLRRRISRHCSCALAHSLQCLPGGSLCAIAIRHSPFAIAFGSPFAIRRSGPLPPSPSAFPTLPPPSPFTIHLRFSLFAFRCSLFAVRCSLFGCLLFPFTYCCLVTAARVAYSAISMASCRRQSGFPSPSAALDFPLVMELFGSMECGGGSRQMVW